MITPPKQSPLLALAYPVAFLAGALLIGTLTSRWILAEPAPALVASAAASAEP
ncbi:hypothetical protein M446_0208 [Methylobacterium sp. 4-46]|uniref:hypothetical protein n=1 Tax=unclassified Methylobacterium TaxID=2615210 RepID=UPI000165C928|nr:MULTISPECIES: hypothetical protein [Methylobacterium]ACA14782.1 hypothetical protein M446_0208 [Methylobacterium sp. 4-46]WFT80531.1 hypothetical protein QA634_01055 [Methylobacterium nodulans]